VSGASYNAGMKTITVRLPESVAAEIEVESVERGVSMSDVVRERLESGRTRGGNADPLSDIRHLIGSVDDDLPADLSARTKHYLRTTGYGRNRNR